MLHLYPTIMNNCSKRALLLQRWLARKYANSGSSSSSTSACGGADAAATGMAACQQQQQQRAYSNKVAGLASLSQLLYIQQRSRDGRPHGCRTTPRQQHPHHHRALHTLQQQHRDAAAAAAAAASTAAAQTPPAAAAAMSTIAPGSSTAVPSTTASGSSSSSSSGGAPVNTPTPMLTPGLMQQLEEDRRRHREAREAEAARREEEDRRRHREAREAEAARREDEGRRLQAALAAPAQQEAAVTAAREAHWKRVVAICATSALLMVRLRGAHCLRCIQIGEGFRLASQSPRPSPSHPHTIFNLHPLSAPTPSPLQYATRASISTAIVPMAEQYEWDKATSGAVLSSFFAGYSVTCVVPPAAAAVSSCRVCCALGFLFTTSPTPLLPFPHLPRPLPHTPQPQPYPPVTHAARSGAAASATSTAAARSSPLASSAGPPAPPSPH